MIQTFQKQMEVQLLVLQTWNMCLDRAGWWNRGHAANLTGYESYDPGFVEWVEPSGWELFSQS